ncbi:MAG: 4-hydroxyphenylpyruvate dioxygenase, partial [uncultured Gemmatimonadetes bacterium]
GHDRTRCRSGADHLQPAAAPWHRPRGALRGQRLPGRALLPQHVRLPAHRPRGAGDRDARPHVGGDGAGRHPPGAHQRAASRVAHHPPRGPPRRRGQGRGLHGGERGARLRVGRAPRRQAGGRARGARGRARTPGARHHRGAGRDRALPGGAPRLHGRVLPRLRSDRGRAPGAPGGADGSGPRGGEHGAGPAGRLGGVLQGGARVPPVAPGDGVDPDQRHELQGDGGRVRQDQVPLRGAGREREQVAGAGVPGLQPWRRRAARGLSVPGHLRHRGRHPRERRALPARPLHLLRGAGGARGRPGPGEAGRVRGAGRAAGPRRRRAAHADLQRARGRPPHHVRGADRAAGRAGLRLGQHQGAVRGGGARAGTPRQHL